MKERPAATDYSLKFGAPAIYTHLPNQPPALPLVEKCSLVDHPVDCQPQTLPGALEKEPAVNRSRAVWFKRLHVVLHRLYGVRIILREHVCARVQGGKRIHSTHNDGVVAVLRGSKIVAALRPDPIHTFPGRPLKKDSIGTTIQRNGDRINFNFPLRAWHRTLSQ